MISCTPRRGADQMIIKVSWGGGIKRRLPQANFQHRFAVVGGQELISSDSIQTRA
jgi:hypothetical protein